MPGAGTELSPTSEALLDTSPTKTGARAEALARKAAGRPSCWLA